MKQPKQQQGFTVPELLIVMVVTALLTSVILIFVFYFWRYSYVLDYSQDSLVQRLNANDFLRDNLGASTGLINQNSIADSHANIIDTNNGPGYWQLLHATPGNYAVKNDGTDVGLFYFRRYSINASNNFIMNGSKPYEDEFVLYLDSAGKRLMLRSIANPSASNNKTITSCPLNLASASCPADKVIIENVQSADLRYFSRSGNLIDWTSIIDPNTGNYAGPDFANVEVVEITINVARAAFYSSTNSTSNSTIIRIALRNY